MKPWKPLFGALAFLVLTGATLTHDTADKKLTIEPAIKGTAIEGGTINSAVIGGTTPAALTVTTSTVNTSTSYPNQALAKFFEQTGNGTNFIGIEAPNAVTADKTFKLPNGDGTAGQVLNTDGSLNLGWASAVTNPMTAAGDIIYSSSGSGTPARLAPGSATQLLHSGTTPSWSAVSMTADVTGTLPLGNGGTNATTKAGAFDSLSPMTTAGDVIYGGASGTGTRLAAGTSTQVFHGGTTPSWSDIVNADINASAAIAGSKLVAAASGVAGAVSTGTQTFTGTKTFETGVSVTANGGNIKSGTTTPTPTNLVNMAVTPTISLKYIAVNNVVHFSFTANVDVTTGGTDYEFRVPLPVASTFTATTDVSGNCSAQSAAAGAFIEGVASGTIRVRGNNTTASSIDYGCVGAYEVK